MYLLSENLEIENLYYVRLMEGMEVRLYVRIFVPDKESRFV
ncbi:hypothetical protein POREN0001_0179 [Porphyromonas endodontalis ATCC 35406]|uniref:Uncharacterized protein n=1 Tax=Porphyromonas endodontalis (strain ATCC 35406 / DSM 24491 / JCM 8526 / CCUG 16442 / BCRC 14492 / NCTC 13058 / HG 370) TaxID=553175 RepID=C3JAE3_POREA|nr:hypothetical protein POREN0001_0179 [Porphyromonas endodontalis ATCC 35406]